MNAVGSHGRRGDLGRIPRGPDRITRDWITQDRSRAARHRITRDRGSITVEMVILTPALALLLLLLAAGARVVEVQGHIDGAARDAARAASVAQTQSQATGFAQQAALGDLVSPGSSWCEPGSVKRPDVSGFQPSGPVTGGLNEADVTVTVRCTVNMLPFTILGFSANWPVSGTAVAPLDPFVCRERAC